LNFSKGQFRRTSSDDEVVRVIVRGIPGTPMPPSNFSESQASTIVAYLRSMTGATSACAGQGCAADAARGRAIFEGKGQCLTCHSVSGAGARTGPVLTEIGAFRRAVELERSIVDPESEIRPENRSVRVVPRDGAPMTGRLLNQDTFSLQIVDSSERLVSIDRSTVREVTVLKTSPMPSYRDKVSAQELADLVSYLASLRGKS
jgi:putative heme-binding domain-containing protein